MEQHLQPEEGNRTVPFLTTPQQPVSQSTQNQESENLDALLSRLQREVIRRSRLQRLYWLITIPYICLYLVYNFNWLVHGIHPPGFYYLMALYIAFSPFVYGAVFKENTARMIAQLDDIRVVGPLADILGIQKGQFQYQERTREMVKLALIQLLPRLQASNASLLNVEQRKSLCRALNDKNSKLVLAILKAFEQVGDAEALPYVQKLVEGKGRARKEKRIQEAAQACLPFLLQRAEQTLARQTLLRASGASGATKEELLRPASGASATDSSQLLRIESPSGPC